MGLIYSSSDASNVINTLNTNLRIANSIMDQLNSGSQRLVAAIDGHTLSGAAYTAGKGLFSELILPTIKRVSTAITNVQNDLTKFSAANSYISDEGYLDEDNLREQLTILQHSKSSLENAAHVVGTLANIPIPAIAELLRDQQRTFLRRAESYQKDIDRVKKKIQKLMEFDAKTKGLFKSSLDDFQLAMQAVMVLNETTVNSDGSYTLPIGVDKSWFIQKKSDKEVIDQIKNGMGVSIPPEIEKLIADNEKKLAQNPELLKTIIEVWKNLKGQVDESSLLTGLVSVAQEMINTKITDQIVDTFSDYLFTYLRNNTTAFLDRGLVAVTNTGANLVVKETPNAFKQLVRVGATRGVPIIGGIFDFGLMKAQGEDTGDAVAKATAHTTISIGAGFAGAAVGEKAGAFIGAGIGTIIPGAGTAVGAVAGGVIGAAVGFVGGVVGSMAFDWLWDNKEEISKTVSNTFNDAKEKGKQVVNNVIDSAKGFIEGLNNLGSVYG